MFLGIGVEIGLELAHVPLAQGVRIEVAGGRQGSHVVSIHILVPLELGQCRLVGFERLEERLPGLPRTDGAS